PQFKEVVSDLNQDEGVLLRFLKAKDYNVKMQKDVEEFCWLFLGTWAAKQLLESVDPEEIQLIEQGLQKTIECGSTGNVVIDMENLSYAQATHIATPWIFSFAFNFLKGVFAQKTMGKIRFISYKEEWQAEFLKRFPRESIVPELRPPCC
ncbi:Sec14 cytosolic factor, partial [Orchesella cincta]